MFEKGIIVGKFAPLTLGHINLINLAAAQCQHLTVILCYDEKFLQQQNERDKKKLTLKNRLRWLNYTYADIPHIDIVHIDETDLPPSPFGWEPYCQLVSQYIHKDKKTALFSSEAEYDEYYKKYLPEVEHVLVDVDRTTVPISATMIRQNLYQYWQYLPSIVQQDYTIKVSILGVMGSGKTTLVKYLTKLFATSAVEDDSVHYENSIYNKYLLLDSQSYPQLVFSNKEKESQSLKTANKLIFTDCNAFMTAFYHRFYFVSAHPLVDAVAHEEQYDLTFILHPNSNLINHQQQNKEEIQLFWDMLKKFPNQTVNGKTIYLTEDSSVLRLKRAVTEIKKYLTLIEQGQ